MIQSSNLNKVLILVSVLFYSCDDDNVNYVACAPNQILDSCGQCYYSQQDEDWNNCLDACNVQFGENICDLEGVLDGNCDCAGCPEFGDPVYCEDCLVEDYCSCVGNNQLRSTFPININTNCSDLDNCDSYSFDNNNLNFKIRERCGLLLNIDVNYIIEGLNNLNFKDPCEEPININYFDNENQTSNVFGGCDLPINTIYALDNGDIIYNSSDDINQFEFSLFNHCEDKTSLTCGQTTGCTWTGIETGCQPDLINTISNGDAIDVGFSIYQLWQNNRINVSGISGGIVIPNANDYINTIIFYNNDPINPIYLKWADVVLGTEYIEIGPLGAYSIAHNNWCDENLGSLLIDNDNLTILPNSIIEGYYYNNDYVKFGDLEINLSFQSLIEFQQSEPEYCR